MSISFDYYKIFYYVATYHSINKAAAILSNSQPNISRSIASLEAQLGCKLFNRSSAGVTLTEAGNDLFAHVEPAFRHLREAEEELRDAIALKRGVLSIGISSGLTRGVIEEFLGPAIHTFHKQYPDVRLEIFHNSSTVLTADVKNNLLDIVFITLDHSALQDSRKSAYQVLHTYSDIVIAGPEYSHLQDRTISISELNEYPIVGLGENTDTFQYYKELFSKYDLEYRPSVMTISTGQILVYTMENYGIGFINLKDAAQALKENKLIRIKLKEKLPKRSICMIKNTKEKHSAAVFEQILNGLS